jgi:hypothetical protein
MVTKTHFTELLKFATKKKKKAIVVLIVINCKLKKVKNIAVFAHAMKTYCGIGLLARSFLNSSIHE